MTSLLLYSACPESRLNRNVDLQVDEWNELKYWFSLVFLDSQTGKSALRKNTHFRTDTIYPIYLFHVPKTRLVKDARILVQLPQAKPFWGK